MSKSKRSYSQSCEKYGNQIRTINIGNPSNPDNIRVCPNCWSDYTEEKNDG